MTQAEQLFVAYINGEPRTMSKEIRVCGKRHAKPERLVEDRLAVEAFCPRCGEWLWRQAKPHHSQR